MRFSGRNDDRGPTHNRNVCAVSKAIFIQPMPTPNPAAIKFQVNHNFLPFGGRDFPLKDTADGSPLAEKLFALNGVGGVFIGTDFVTITENDETDWVELGDQVIDTVREHIFSGDPHVKADDGDLVAFSPEDEDTVKRIVEILDNDLRPAVAMDGGDIRFVALRDGYVHLQLIGSCAGCPSSTATLRQGIEARLRDEIPDLAGVIQV